MKQLKETWRIPSLIFLLIIAVIIILLNPIKNNNKEDASKMTLNEGLNKSSLQANVKENSVSSDNKITTENVVDTSPIGIVVDTFPERLCSEKIQDEIEEIKKTYLFLINNKEYDTRIKEATVCQDSDANCHERSFVLNQEKIQNEIVESKYNLVNGCLYQDGLRVFDFDLSAYYKTDFFGSNLESKFDARLTPGTLQSTFEWFRFEDDGKLFIYLKNTAGCGGCVFIGHYLEIDLKTGEITGKYQDGLNDYFNTILSPSKKQAVIVLWDKENYRTKLDLYDFTNFSQKLLYTIPEDKSILSIGYGTQSEQGAISWLDNETIALQLFEKNIDGENGDIGGVKYKINEAGKNEAIKSGPILEIKVIE